MTLKEIEECTDEILIPRQIAPILKCDPYCINLQAQRCPEKLGFPVIVMGSRVKIPRLAFLEFIKGENLNLTERTSL